MTLHKPRIMGILNLTEDSFSDGGKYLDSQKALMEAQNMIRQGLQILDIGAESTRPGSIGVPADLQWQRISPVLSKIKELFPSIQVSIDTQSVEVAAKAITFGADIINDISALGFDPAMAELIAANPQVSVVLMHMQGTPQTMQLDPQYEDVLLEVSEYLEERANYAISKGIDPKRIIIDPGIGFGKTLEHNLQLLANLKQFKALGFPILLGASRKRFISDIYPSAADQRLGGSLATTLWACQEQIDIIRVHDVKAHRQFMDVLSAIYQAGE